MRAFIAIELPADVRRALAMLGLALADSGADVKWVDEPNLHVTMRFLGDVTDEQRQTVAQLLHRIADHTPSIPMALAGLGAFPSMASPRVVWVGVGQGAEALTRIAESLDEGLAGLGFAREARRFVAHITLGRVRSTKRLAQLTEHLKTLEWAPPEPVTAEHVTLFQSTLTSHGSIYTPLVRVPFTQG